MNLSRILAALVVLSLFAPVAEARPKLTKNILKTFFETGDVPTQSQFGTLIDSLISRVDDKSLLGLRVYDTAVYRPPPRRHGINEVIPDTTLDYVLPNPSSLFTMAPEFAGQFGYAALLYGDTTGQHYHAFLQLSMEPLSSPPNTSGLPQASTSPAIFVQYLVMETSPGTPLTTFVVPEPTTIACLAWGALLARRSRTVHSSI